MKKIYIIILIMMSISISPVLGVDNQSINNSKTFRILVDQYNGFYRAYEIYNVTLAKAAPYENRSLNISRGDTIIWINDAVPDTELTMVSKEGLWDKYNGTLKWSYKQFIYTFNKSGIYEIYVKEYPRFRQTIKVGPLDIENVNNTNNTINQTNITKQNSTVDNTNKNKTIINTSNNSMPTVPLEKKQGNEVVVLITVTLSLIYIFDRKIK